MAVCRLRPELETMLRDLQRLFSVKVFRDKEAAGKAWW
jgi:hypothetical protein